MQIFVVIMVFIILHLIIIIIIIIVTVIVIVSIIIFVMIIVSTFESPPVQLVAAPGTWIMLLLVITLVMKMLQYSLVMIPPIR